MSHPRQRLPAGLRAQPGSGASLPGSPLFCPIGAQHSVWAALQPQPPGNKSREGGLRALVGPSQPYMTRRTPPALGRFGSDWALGWGGWRRNLNVSPSCSVPWTRNAGLALCFDQSLRPPWSCCRPRGLMICGQSAVLSETD